MSAVRPLVSSREGGSGAGAVPGPSDCAPATAEMATAPVTSARDKQVRRRRDADGMKARFLIRWKAARRRRRAFDVRLYLAAQQTGPRNAVPVNFMPELPEVETTRRGVAPHAVGRRIVRLVVYDSRLRWPVPAELAQRVAGRRIDAIERRSKY